MSLRPTIVRVVERSLSILKIGAGQLRRLVELPRPLFARYLYLLLYSRWRAATLIASVAVVAWLVTALGVPAFSRTTMTATARTEVLSFKLGRDQALDWPLPAGTFASFDSVDGFSCQDPKADAFFHVCMVPEGMSLHVENWAEVSVVVIPEEELGASAAGPHVSIEVMAMQEPSEEPQRGDPLFGCVKPIGESDSNGFRPTSIELRNARGQVVYASDDAFAFETGDDFGWEVPLEVSNLLLGESLLSGVGWQPIVTQGEVRLFASSGLAWWRPQSRYLVFEDTLDSADVVKIPLSGCFGNRLLGLVSYDDSGVLDVTAHTGATAALVSRLGGEHAIRISMWDILAGQPVWLAVLALFVWAVMILDYIKDEDSAGRIAEFIESEKKGSRGD